MAILSDCGSLSSHFQHPQGAQRHPLARLALSAELIPCFAGVVVLQQPAPLIILLLANDCQCACQARILAKVEQRHGVLEVELIVPRYRQFFLMVSILLVSG